MEMGSIPSEERLGLSKSNVEMINAVIGENTSGFTLNPQATRTSRSNSRSSPKYVTFEYLLSETQQHRARLPMRVNIYPHDEIDSIVATVKNFFGLYDSSGVTFEDKDGNVLLGQYEDIADKQTVYVRVVDEGDPNLESPLHNSPRRLRLGPAFELLPNSILGSSISRPSSRTTTKKRSASPASNSGNRSVSVSTVKSRSKKSRVGSVHGDGDDSESDIGNASVTSSRRGKSDVVASAEISVDNIVEGGRRKRARFDSSELPLFVPSQVPLPGSISSVSPQRKTGPYNAMSPFQPPHQALSYSVLPSPQSYGHPDNRQFGTFASATKLSSYPTSRQSGSGILPTPDPTIGSVISDEDVALQLMRLGDASNYSSHGRTSTSTLDDALSGKAAASSAEDTDDESEHDHSHEFDADEEEHFHPEIGDEGLRNIKRPRTTSNGIKSKSRKSKMKTIPNTLSVPLPSTPKPGQQPNLNFQHFQNPLGEDEEDLSTKPRCQRCRKSKKGCDRQRPCGRCKDAGIGIEGCVSEDEGNGRKGRYGRHMGVPIKKSSTDDLTTDIQHNASMGPPPISVMDKSKKRKR